MRKAHVIIFLLISICVVSIFYFKNNKNYSNYLLGYSARLTAFNNKQKDLLQLIRVSDLNAVADIEKIKSAINIARNDLKAIDFWLRYLQPNGYRQINGPLPVEWETEVFGKYEPPYRRKGAGLTLAALYLDEEKISKDSLVKLVSTSINVARRFGEDWITNNLKTYNHFYLCNRLFLLNLASIYTTGFECPDTSRIIPELRLMLENTRSIYTSFNEGFSRTPLSEEYLDLFDKAKQFVTSQSNNFSNFDQFLFIKDYINPLFKINQGLIRKYHASSKSVVDYTLNPNTNSIFDKTVYSAKDSKGIFLKVEDKTILAEIDRIGKLLFYDPILSGNNLRSCNSCHKSTEYFTDNLRPTGLQFNRKDFLPRNAPSLINAKFNHLLMLDGRQLTLQTQLHDVVIDSVEMASDSIEVLEKIMSCVEYNKAFTKLLKYTPGVHEVNLNHIASAITFYYSKFSDYYAPFDDAINENKYLEPSAHKGFNLFMSKAQCGTCHFPPQFNGVKPPFVGSEFEVLGVPKDRKHLALSADKGRAAVNEAYETINAFRTGSIRNAEKTKPYMHNGVFDNLEEVIDFYDFGGGTGHRLKVPNQTLSGDSLHLSKKEKSALLAFINSLNEKIPFENPPDQLPLSYNPLLNTRKVGGVY